MNRNKLKSYAPQARREFIKAVTDRAAFYGLTADKIEPVTEKGDVAVIGGKAFPKSVAKKRKLLEQRIARQGFEQVMEAMAYTWFNRFVAIRYMELHGYLDHGYRVLSNPGGGTTPEIIEQAEHVDLPGLKKEEVIELKLAGNKEAELYDKLLLAQCHALHKAMPFLFEPIDDETELLLPDNLLHSDSLIRKLVAEIPEEDWQEVEIIGWLYQFYISEKKDEVIGKVVASEDIPAATQLFTPNWIVKYLVQNSLGRQWMATYPDSPLKAQMEYYIEPAEQTPEVQAQLVAITPKELNPEELTLMDPACGSGHILVEAYDLLKAIYQERGYRAKDIPRLILEKNLFGLEIDDRAAQLAAFALMVKARADDRRIFEADVQPHVLTLHDSDGLSATDIAEALNAPITRGSLAGNRANVATHDISTLIDVFACASSVGSLIQIPKIVSDALPSLEQRARQVLANGELFAQPIVRFILPLVRQAKLLASKYDVVAANPPYMGSRYHNPQLKAFLQEHYKPYRTDLFSAFAARLPQLSKTSGHIGLMAPNVWMFISTHEELRRHMIARRTLTSLIQLSTSGFDGATVHICTCCFQASHVSQYLSTFIRLSDFRGTDSQPDRTLEALRDRRCGWLYHARMSDFVKVPTAPIAYWISDRMRNLFEVSEPLHKIAEPKVGLQTGDNSRFVRLWHEVDYTTIGFGMKSRTDAKLSRLKWFPYNKGGDFRRWYGNNEHVVNWENDGAEIRSFCDEDGNLRSRPQNIDFFFRPSVTWSFISSSYFGVRLSDHGFIFDVAGSSAFPPDDMRSVVIGFLCSNLAFEFMKAMNPTLNFQVGNVAMLPFPISAVRNRQVEIIPVVEEALALSRSDWDVSETSWGFAKSPLLAADCRLLSVDESYASWSHRCLVARTTLRRLEEKNNSLFVETYGLEQEVACEVLDEQITLYQPERDEDVKRLISYAIGCVLGRYSLDGPGLVYAQSGNQGFDPTKYKVFHADPDGIIPITDTEWFSDDAANRVVEFIATAWPREHLEENLTFLAESLGPNKGESSRDTIRRYLSQGFYKHHLSMYKKRPIYWLFSSGKQGAFECLVYLHRYNEGTLARMRTEYVIPLQGKIDARIEQLREDIASATSSAHGKRLQKERDKLVKQQAELRKFDEKLRHYADLRISLDMDDGVKVNYGKFGDLLAEVKTVAGAKVED